MQLQGLNLSSHFPLTTQQLLVQQAFPDLMDLYAAILKDLPGYRMSVWEKVQRQFAAFVQARNGDHALAALFDFETWMNECMMNGPVEKTRIFALNALALTSALNKKLCPVHEQVSLAYTSRGLWSCRETSCFCSRADMHGHRGARENSVLYRGAVRTTPCYVC